MTSPARLTVLPSTTARKKIDVGARGLRGVYALVAWGLRSPPRSGRLLGFIRLCATRSDSRRQAFNARNEGVPSSNLGVGSPESSAQAEFLFAELSPNGHRAARCRALARRGSRRRRPRRHRAPTRVLRP